MLQPLDGAGRWLCQITVEPDEDVIVSSRRYGNHLGVELGVAYESSAVFPDGTHPPVVEDGYSDYVQSATPGCRAPHVWLGRPDARLSTLDLMGPAFTLHPAPDATAWCRIAADAARKLGVRIDRYWIGAPGLDDRGAFVETYGLKHDGAVLVRPDGHVGWRSACRPTTGSELVAALGRILGRSVQTDRPTRSN